MYQLPFKGNTSLLRSIRIFFFGAFLSFSFLNAFPSYAISYSPPTYFLTWKIKAMQYYFIKYGKKHLLFIFVSIPYGYLCILHTVNVSWKNYYYFRENMFCFPSGIKTQARMLAVSNPLFMADRGWSHSFVFLYNPDAHPACTTSAHSTLFADSVGIISTEIKFCH